MHSEQQVAPPRPLEPVLSARPRWRLSIRLIWLFAGTSAVLVLGEAATRLAVAVTHRIPIFVSDARAGWANRRNLQNERRVGDGGEFTISTHEEGHRLTRAAGEPLPPTGVLSSWQAIRFAWGRGSTTPRATPGYSPMSCPAKS